MAGIEHARQRGTKSGKALGRPKVVFRRDRAVELRKAGRSWREIANEWGGGVTTVSRAGGGQSRIEA